MALRHRERQIDNLLERLGRDPSGQLRVESREVDLDLEKLHEVELKRFHEYLARFLAEHGLRLEARAEHSPHDPMPGCECALCTQSTAPLTAREAKELGYYAEIVTPS